MLSLVIKPGLLAAVAVAALCPLSPASAKGTRAGTQIVNVAQASYVDSGSTQIITSNPVMFTVEEVIDLVLAPVGTQPLLDYAGGEAQPLHFRLTNSGNGPEAFALTIETALGGDDFDPAFQRIVIDTNGNNFYDPLQDSIYTPGDEPEIEPENALDIFVFAALPAGLPAGNDGILSLSATSMTGTGEPGTAFPGGGFAGTIAVMGATGGETAAKGAWRIDDINALLAKTQALSGNAASGGIITYELTADLSGIAASAPRITDVIPAGTSFVPGSLALDGRPLTDAADADEGQFDGTRIEVALVESAGAPQRVTFQVRID